MCSTAHAQWRRTTPTTPGAIDRVANKITNSWAVDRVARPASARDVTAEELSARRAIDTSAMRFERNQGQYADAFDFIARGAGYTMFIQPAGALMSVGGGKAAIGMTLLGAHVDARAVTSEPTGVLVNYYVGRDRSRWRHDVPSYRRVRYAGVYDDIDVEYHGLGGKLEYDFIVAPGADPSRIRMAFDGLASVCIDDDGALAVEGSDGHFRHERPIAYQTLADGSRHTVSSRFVVRNGSVGFELGAYDHGRDLVIDPAVVNTHYVAANYHIDNIVIGGSGSLYVAGSTIVSEIPPTNNAMPSGVSDAWNNIWVLKMNPDGSTAYCTYIGGSDYDDVAGIAVDGFENLYAIGDSDSLDFPTTAGVVQPEMIKSTFTYSATPKVVVFKLSSTGALTFATYLGGDSQDSAAAIAVDSTYNVYVAGNGWSEALPGTIDNRPTANHGFDSFIAKLAPDATSITWMSIVNGQAGSTNIRDIVLDDTNGVYFTGDTNARMPVTSGGLRPWAGTLDHGFVGKLTPSGSLQYLTYIGGSYDDYPLRVRLDPSNNVYVVGRTRSSDLPTTSDAIQKVPLNTTDNGFFIKLDPTLATTLYSTYLSATASAWATDVYVEVDGTATILAYGASPNQITDAGFPLLNDFPNTPPVYGGTYVLRFSPTNQLLYSACFPNNPAQHMAGQGVGVYVPVYGSSGLHIRRVIPSGQSYFVVGDFDPPGSSDYPGQQFRATAEIGTFPNGTQVRFGGALASSTYLASPTRIEGTAPTLGSGTYDVTISSTSEAAILVHAWEATPGHFTVSSINPSTVPAWSGSFLTISGAGFPPRLWVRISSVSTGDSVDAGWHRANSNTVYVQVPSLKPGVYDVTLAALSPFSGASTGVTLTGALTVTGPQAIVRSYSGSTAGDSFYLSGNDVDATSSVTFDGTQLTRDGSGNLVAPPHSAGTVNVIVNTKNGSASFPNGYLYVQKVTVDMSLQPTSGSSFGGTSVTITGTGFVSGAKVFFDNLLASNVVVTGSTTITATTPAHTPGQAKVYVVNPDGGNSYPYNGFTFTGPFVSSASPASGPGSGTIPSINMFGSGFDSTCRISFDGVPGVVNSTSDNSMVVTPPAHAPGVVDIVVTNAAGETGKLLASFTYLDVTPTLAGISPAFGPSSGGTTVTITGTGFSSGTRVTFGGLLLQNPVITSTSITGQTPPGAVGPATVRIVNPDGQALQTTFTYMAPPTLTTVSPASGPATGGTVVTLIGTNFDASATVMFGGTAAATVTFGSSTSIQATTPPHAAADADVVVTNPDGGFAKKTNGFRFLPPAPTISGFSPSIGVVGSQVVVTGMNFLFVSSVKFSNNVSAGFNADSDTQITATVPAGAVTGSISVTTQSGTATSASTYTVDTTGPRIDNFTPTSGISGTSVTVTGIRFTGATQVQFGGVSASSFTVDSDTQITAVVPATALTGPITVTSSLGTGTSGSNFTAAPRFATTPFSPASGPSGSTVTISGFNFQGATQVLFNGTAATSFTVNSGGTSITATVPAAATTGPITVTTAVSSVTTTTSFAVAPTITSFTPAGGAGGTLVTITGLHFTGATSVTFGGVAATFTVVSDTTISATVPASSPTGVIAVTTPAGTATSATQFLAGAKITSFTPAKGDVGTVVTITGQYFTGATGVAFNGVAATAFNIVSDTSITATVPSGAMTGPISVTTAVATASSSTNFYMPITVSGFTPTSGPAGTVITITGTSMTGVNQITINGMKFVVGAFFPISPTQLRATVPNLASTGPLVISSPYYSVQTTASFTVTPGPPPTYRGDSNGDGALDAADVFYLIRYLFAGGTAPIHTADANNDGKVNAGDIFFLINYIFSGGPAPAASVPVRIESTEKLAPLTLSLGTPARRGSELAVPVIVAGGEVGALALQLRVEGGAAEDLKIVRSSKLEPVFETTARGSDSVSYVGSFASVSAAQPVVVAEVVVPAGDRVVLSIDGETTAIGGANGSNVRTVANDGLVIARGAVELCAGCADRDRGVRKQ